MQRRKILRLYLGVLRLAKEILKLAQDDTQEIHRLAQDDGGESSG